MCPYGLPNIRAVKRIGNSSIPVMKPQTVHQLLIPFDLRWATHFSNLVTNMCSESPSARHCSKVANSSSCAPSGSSWVKYQLRFLSASSNILQNQSGQLSLYNSSTICFWHEYLKSRCLDFVNFSLNALSAVSFGDIAVSTFTPAGHKYRRVFCYNSLN